MGVVDDDGRDLRSSAYLHSIHRDVHLLQVDDATDKEKEGLLQCP